MSSLTIWNAIARLFGAKSSAKISALRHSLHSQRKAGLSVSEYLEKIKSVCDMLNAAWCVVTEQEQVSVVLVGLSMEFESIIAIASRDTLSLDALTEMFLDCEARHKMFLSDGLSANMVVHSNDTRADDVPVKVSTDEEITEKQSSQARGQQGNSYRGRGRGRFNGSNRPQCQLCGKFGHTVKKCYHRFDRDFTGITIGESLHNDIAKKSLSMNADNLFSHSFSPRMQAYTHHMPSLYPAGFMYPSTVYPGTLGMSAPFYHGLPYASFTSLLVDTLFSNSPQNVSSAAFVSTLPAASSNVSSQSTATNAIWYPDTGATHHVSNDLSVFVSDVWGPAPFTSSDGYVYYVSFIDVCSRYTWLYLLKRKSEVAQCFIHFYKMVEVQFGHKIKAVQSDGGGEYQALYAWFRDHGIQHRLSCPSTSEQNGKAERKHRHVVEMGLTLLAQAHLPLKFWSHAFTAAVYMINRLPTDVLDMFLQRRREREDQELTVNQIINNLCSWKKRMRFLL